MDFSKEESFGKETHMYSQSVLIKSLLKQSHIQGTDRSSLKLFNKWLSLQSASESGRSAVITQNDVIFIIKEIITYFNDFKSADDDLKIILLDTLRSMLSNSTFQQYLRHHAEVYCDVFSTPISKMQELNDVKTLLKCTNDFFKQAALHSDFRLHFLKTLFIPLVTTAAKFTDDLDVFKESSHVLQKCIIYKNFEFFESDTNTEGIEIKNEFVLVFNTILSFYNNQDLALVKFSYRLLFECVINFYDKNFKAVYSFFVFLVGSIGLDINDAFHIKTSLKLPDLHLSFSLEVLADAINILANHNCALDCAVNKITFSDFLKNIVISVMNLAIIPNLHVHSILHNVVTINPLIIEQTISDTLIYLMINQYTSPDIQRDYEKLMEAVFQVFSKLHRIEKLISVMIQSIKVGLDGKPKQDQVYYGFLGENDVVKKRVTTLPNVENMLSDAVLQAFSCRVTALVSWQVINIFKTFNFHLAATTLQIANGDETFCCYVEILSGLFCCFLRSVRVAEHTVSTAVQEKFCKMMEELKSLLSKFGTALLNKEHNHVLMRSYLNLCTAYGDTCIVSGCYPSEMSNILTKVEDSDYSLCNLVYLHDYLSREQWCIIAQRITNFGETQCKHIVQKLYLQKLRAMHTFNATCYAEIKRSFIKDVTLEAEEDWKNLLQESFFVNHILPDMEHQNILSAADFIFKACVADESYLIKNQSLITCHVLMRSVLYCAIHKMSKLFKQKQKCGEGVFCKKLFKKIDASLLINGNEIKEVPDDFAENLKQNWITTANKIDFEKLDTCLKIIKQLPVFYLPAATQDILLLFLIALLHDCKSDSQNKLLEERLEPIITGLVQCNTSVLPRIVPFNIMLSSIIPLFVKWKDILTTFLAFTIKNIDALRNLQGGVNYILDCERDEFLKYATIFLNLTNEQTKKVKLSAEHKKILTQYRLQICEKIVSHLTIADLNLNETLEPFVFALKFYLSQDKPSSLSKIENMLTPHLDYAITDMSNRSLQLLITVLHNKSCLNNTEPSLPFKIWQTIQQHAITDEIGSKNHLQLHALILEHVSDDQFATVTNDLFETTIKALYSDDVEKCLYYLEIWNFVLTSCFNPTKTKLWQRVLDKLLKEQFKYLSHNKDLPLLVVEEIGKIQLHIIQAIQVPLTGTMIDIIVSTPSVLLNSAKQNFSSVFALCISIMEYLLKQRNPLIMDRLPIYLQQYRYFLQQICIHGNCDLNLSIDELYVLADCAYMLERLTNMLVFNRKHLQRVAPYVIADLLFNFEQYTLPSNIRVHLNNCFNSLISLCDHHAVSYLMRALSTASTEMFKIMFEHYKKHYRFTGKV